jgi:hypothetical protein
MNAFVCRARKRELVHTAADRKTVFTARPMYVDPLSGVIAVLDTAIHLCPRRWTRGSSPRVTVRLSHLDRNAL